MSTDLEALISFWSWLDTRAGLVFLVGLTTLVVWHWWRCRVDCTLALNTRRGESESIQLHSTPPVSILVAAWNEADIIREHVESFLALQYPRKQLIICAGGSDDTYPITQEYAGDQVIVIQQQSGEGKQRALRRCLEYATGDVIFLTDADCLLDDESFERTIAPVVQGEEEVATGWVRPLDTQLADSFVAYRWAEQQYWIARSPRYLEGLEGRNAALDRRTLEEVGSFDMDVATGTDYFLANLLIASGRRIRCVPASLIRTVYPIRLCDYFMQKSRWVRNNVLHAARFHIWRKVRQELYAGIVGLFAIAIPLTLGGLSWFVWSLWGVVVVRLLLLRLQMLLCTQTYNEEQLSIRRYIVPMLSYTIVDCAASFWALVECTLPVLRQRW